jgi:hypothetical protein
MELHELLDRLVSALDRLQIPYLITGSVAAIGQWAEQLGLREIWEAMLRRLQAGS